MLRAEKEAVQSSLKVETLAIRDKELHWYLDSFQALTISSSLLAGICYAGVNQVGPPIDPVTESQEWQFAYYTLTVLSMMSNFVSLMISIVSCVYAPALALRGPDGSLKVVIQELSTHKKSAVSFFWAGIFFFIVSLIPWAALKQPKIVAYTTIALQILALLALLLYGFYIHSSFKIETNSRESSTVGSIDNPETQTYVVDSPLVAKSARASPICSAQPILVRVKSLPADRVESSDNTGSFSRSLKALWARQKSNPTTPREKLTPKPRFQETDISNIEKTKGFQITKQRPIRGKDKDSIRSKDKDSMNIKSRPKIKGSKALNKSTDSNFSSSSNAILKPDYVDVKPVSPEPSLYPVLPYEKYIKAALARRKSRDNK